MSPNQPIQRTDTETLEVYQLCAHTREETNLQSLQGLRTDAVSYRDAAVALWGEESGTQKAFTTALQGKGYDTERTKVGAVWHGIGLAADDDGEG